MMSKVLISEYKTITHEQLVRYAGASGDFNPIHTVVPKAREGGFSDVIAHGMYIMGLASAQLMKWFPLQDISSYEVRFVAPTYPGEQIRIQCELNDKRSNGRVIAMNQEGVVKLKGKVYFFEHS